MMKKLLLSLIIPFLLIAFSGFTRVSHAQRNKNAIKQLLQKRDRQIKAIVGPKGSKYSAEQRQKLKKVINDVIDYRAMAKYALQNTWNNISSQKQKEFVHLFSTIIRDHSLSQLDIYRAHIRYLSISVHGDDALVKTLATLKDVRKRVDYKLHYKPDKKKWVVTDFLINDVSTANSYRRQFQDIIRKKGFNHLMESLRKRANR
jgi:phospholipid transport system substrate-binding protein